MAAFSFFTNAPLVKEGVCQLLDNFIEKIIYLWDRVEAIDCQGTKYTCFYRTAN